MNSTANMSHEDVIRVKLEVLRREHRDLDEAIEALQEAVAVDQLTLKRLKKQKLGLKDRIASIEDELNPGYYCINPHSGYNDAFIWGCRGRCHV